MSILISVIIPTFNRLNSLLRTLQSLDTQTLSSQTFEVIVVDDGSDYLPEAVYQQAVGYELFYLRKKNEGATIARNFGARKARGEVLVFMDDDVTISSQTLAILAARCQENERILVTGTLIPSCENATQIYTQIALAIGYAEQPTQANGYIDFSFCNTQLLAVRHEDFLALGMFQDPSGGWPNWDDVDFGYRANLQGYRLWRCEGAIGCHWDYSLVNLKTACQRWQRASKSVVRLFQIHPGLIPSIPMYHDKHRIVWSQDPPRLILRKLLRRLASTETVTHSFEMMATWLEQHWPQRQLLRRLYTWIAGAYMFRGYQEGLQTYMDTTQRG